jgi:hypothetical protein
MRKLGLIGLLWMVVLCVPGMASTAKADSIVITFKDGHQQAFALGEIAHIEFKTSTVAAAPAAKSSSLGVPGRGSFIGKWTVSEGGGMKRTFYITLEKDGQCIKSIGATHGTWVYVDGEARVSWDDGWHDAIRRVGLKYEKFAYAPGASFSDTPNNVTDARRTNPEPI